MHINERIRAIITISTATNCRMQEANDDLEAFIAADPAATWRQAADAIISSRGRVQAVEARHRIATQSDNDR